MQTLGANPTASNYRVFIQFGRYGEIVYNYLMIVSEFEYEYEYEYAIATKALANSSVDKFCPRQNNVFNLYYC